MAERYPRRLVNSACARALADGIYSYRHVKVATERLVPAHHRWRRPDRAALASLAVCRLLA